MPAGFASTTRPTTGSSIHSISAIPPGPTAGPGALAGRVPYTPVPYEYTAGPPRHQRRHGAGHAVRRRRADTAHLAVDHHRRLHRRVSLLSRHRPRQRRDDLSAQQPAGLRPHLLRADRSRRPEAGRRRLRRRQLESAAGPSRRRPGRRRRMRRRSWCRRTERGDFNTVQGALDFVPDRSPRRITVFIRNGDYEEIVYFRNKSNLTLLGEDRERVQIHYANNEIFNPHPSNVAHATSGRARSRRAAPRSWPTRRIDVHLVNLTIRNTARGQAEGLLVTGERNIVSHVSDLRIGRRAAGERIGLRHRQSHRRRRRHDPRPRPGVLRSTASCSRAGRSRGRGTRRRTTATSSCNCRFKAPARSPP